MGKCHCMAGLNKHTCLDCWVDAFNFESTLFSSAIHEAKHHEVPDYEASTSKNTFSQFSLHYFFFNFKPNLVIHAHKPQRKQDTENLDLCWNRNFNIQPGCFNKCSFVRSFILSPPPREPAISAAV